MFIANNVEIILKKYQLGFIRDEDLYLHTRDTVEKYKSQMNLKEFKKNIIDPIKLTFDSRVYNKTIEDLIEGEVIRQIDKANTNHIGYFHQNIFNYISNDWHVPKNGFDIINTNKKYYVEMKNKHNTMNSSAAQKTYMRMQNKIINEPSAICMLVEVIAKKSQNIKWDISLDGRSVSNTNIRRLSIDKFYELVTGDRIAFKRLCEKLPIVIDDIIKDSAQLIVSNTVFEELQRISPRILKSLYLLSFEKYEGFGDFNV